MKPKIFFLLSMLIIISCAGSKSDINDPILNNSSNTTNVNNNSNSNQTQVYTFKNELVWSDEFDGESLSNINWNIETIPPNNGSWWNGELQFYTDKEDNIKLKSMQRRIQ